MDIFTTWFCHISGHGLNKTNFFRLMNTHTYVHELMCIYVHLHAYTMLSIVRKHEGNRALYHIDNCPSIILMVSPLLL